MLPSSKRLSANDNKDIMEKGRVTHSPLFLLRALATDAHTRIAAIVPVKVVKTAAGRNSLKRKIYEAVHKIYPHTISGFNVAIFAKAPAVTVSSFELEQGIKELFIKAKLTR